MSKSCSIIAFLKRLDCTFDEAMFGTILYTGFLAGIVNKVLRWTYTFRCIEENTI